MVPQIPALSLPAKLKLSPQLVVPVDPDDAREGEPGRRRMIY